MASQRVSTEDRGNLQVIVVNLNGNNTTIQDALRTVDNMIRRHGTVSRDVQSLENRKGAKSLPNGKGQNGDAPAEDELRLFVDPAENDPEPPAPGSSTPRAPGSRRGRAKTTGIPDLDFNSAKPTFREFAAQKKPADQFDWYLLVASWMKTQKQVDEIGIAHVITASQYIGSDWSLPEDIGQPFRDGRRRDNGFFVKGSKNGMSKINSVGEDRVARMGTTSPA
jgi:hypothetical protein